MAYTVVRIARSEIVKDVMDFSAALCDADGQMVAQAKTIALHLGAIPKRWRRCWPSSATTCTTATP